MNDMIGIFRFLYFVSILLIAAACDIRSHKIPNWLTIPSFLVAVSYHATCGGVAGLIFSLQGVALGMGIFSIPYLMGGMGAGDVKLMGVVGAFLGMGKVAMALLWTAVIGGLYAIVLLTYYATLKRTIRPCPSAVCPCEVREEILTPSGAKLKKPCLYYGVVIAIGTFLSLAVRIPLLPNL
jgi:prepilin peptidase CpaA